jgi:DNA-directed RNA polymerase specialized sigma24 family protein
VLNALALHISDAIMRILRKAIGRNHRNEGLDIIADVHGQLIEALLKPGSADGNGLRKAFVPRVGFRAADALRKEQKTKQQERSAEGLEEIYVNGPSQEIDPRRLMEEGIDVERALERITDDRMRLAFRLHMEGYPAESSRTASIAKALGVSGKTASQWIAEVQSLLSKTVGEEI